MGISKETARHVYGLSKKYRDRKMVVQKRNEATHIKEREFRRKNFLVAGTGSVGRDIVWATLSRVATLVPNRSQESEHRASSVVRMVRRMRSTSQHIAVALSYMERIDDFQPPRELLRGGRTNWRQQYFFVCLLLAHKYLDDNLFETEYYADALKFRSKENLIRWQRHVLVEKLDFDIFVTPVCFEKHMRLMDDGGDVLSIDLIE